MKISLTFIRNGFTEAEKQGASAREDMIPGVPDEPLCQKSASEIKARASEKIYPTFGWVYTSPLRSCVETAQIIYGTRPMVRKEAFFFDLGKFTGKTQADIKKYPEYQEWAGAEKVEAFLGGEEPYKSVDRMIREFCEIINDLEENGIDRASMIMNIAMIRIIINEFWTQSYLYWDGDIPYGGGCVGTMDTFTWQFNLEKMI